MRFQEIIIPTIEFTIAYNAVATEYTFSAFAISEGPTTCGAQSYELFAGHSSISVVSSDSKITVLTTDPYEIGVYSDNIMRVWLTSYPNYKNVVNLLQPFTIEIKGACE